MRLGHVLFGFLLRGTGLSVGFLEEGLLLCVEIL